MAASPYIIDSDQRDVIEQKVIDALNTESVVKPLRDRLAER